ncbi:MAG: hypothetical protein DMG23_09975 [Acidobacteria bacterium]|nr:MAG: hypothetical protein DMG23_09975 [Acidobacteriota bacterium]
MRTMFGPRLGLNESGAAETRGTDARKAQKASPPIQTAPAATTAFAIRPDLLEWLTSRRLPARFWNARRMKSAEIETARQEIPGTSKYRGTTPSPIRDCNTPPARAT